MSNTSQFVMVAPRIETEFAAPLVILLHDVDSDETEILERWQPYLDERARLISLRDAGWINAKSTESLRAAIRRVGGIIANIRNEHAPTNPHTVVLGEGRGGTLALALFLRGHMVTQFVAINPDLPKKARPGFIRRKRGWVECFVAQATQGVAISPGQEFIVDKGRQLFDWLIDHNRDFCYREFDMGRAPSTECLTEVARWIGPMRPPLSALPTRAVDPNSTEWDSLAFLEEYRSQFADILRLRYAPQWQHKTQILLELAQAGFLQAAGPNFLSLDIEAQLAALIDTEFPSSDIEREYLSAACFGSLVLGALSGKYIAGELTAAQLLRGRAHLATYGLDNNEALSTVFNNVVDPQAQQPTWDRIAFFNNCLTDFAIRIATSVDAGASDTSSALMQAAFDGFHAHAPTSAWNESVKDYLGQALRDDFENGHTLDPLIQAVRDRTGSNPGSPLFAFHLFTAYCLGGISGLYCQEIINDDETAVAEEIHIPFYRSLWASKITRNLRRADLVTAATVDIDDAKLFADIVGMLTSIVTENGPNDHLGVPTRWAAFASSAFGILANDKHWDGDIEYDTMSRLIPAAWLPFTSSRNAFAVTAFVCTAFGALAAKRRRREIDQAEQHRLECVAVISVSKYQADIGRAFDHATGGSFAFPNGSSAFGFAFSSWRSVDDDLDDEGVDQSKTEESKYAEEYYAHALADFVAQYTVVDPSNESDNVLVDWAVRGYLDRTSQSETGPEKREWLKYIVDLNFTAEVLAEAQRDLPFKVRSFGSYCLGAITGDYETGALNLMEHSRIMLALSFFCFDHAVEIAAAS